MTATTAILTALRASTLPAEAQAFLASIAEGEGTIDYATLYSGGTLVNSADSANIQMDGDLREWTGSLATFPTWSGATIPQATSDFSTAAGFCQDTRTTWDEYATQFGVADFTPPSQISFNWQLAQLRFGTPMGSGLLAVLQAGETAMIPAYLVKTWPGGASTSFPTRYAANLTALQAAPAAPPGPTTITVPLPATETAPGSDGKSYTIVYEIVKTTGAALLACWLGMSSTAPESPQADPAATKPHSVFDSSTFRFDRSPDGGIIAVPLVEGR